MLLLAASVVSISDVVNATQIPLLGPTTSYTFSYFDRLFRRGG